MSDVDAVRWTVSELVRWLENVIGRPLVTDLAGSKDPKAVPGWIDGSRTPRPRIEARLRAAAQATEAVAGLARNWFLVPNPHLGYDTPVEALAGDRLKDVVRAARHFGNCGSEVSE